MSILDFKTKTNEIPRKNGAKEGHFVLALDIGYSAVKGFSDNKAFIFPSYARKIDDRRVTLKEPDPTDIMYRDEDGTWIVGSLAYADVTSSDTVIDSESELYGRHRFYSPMFKAILRTAYGIGLTANPYGNPAGKEIMVQTGLPVKYEKADSGDLMDVLQGRHVFEIKLGRRPWQKFDITIPKKNISIMPQPLGALISASTDKFGRPVADAKKYFSGKLIVFDPGFGTLDDYTVNHGTVVPWQCETFPEYGMREVFQRTVNDIYHTFGVSIEIPELQNHLTNGKIRVVSKKEMKSKEYSIDNILKENCKQVFKEAIEKMKSAHNYFADVDYIIATGGTYEAWKEDFEKIFQDMDGLTVIPANVNDPSLSNVFSNVRGYYYYKASQIR